MFAISIVATLVWPIWLTNSTTGAADPLTSFVWWANGITWFALLVYIFVNIANIVFFWRYRRSAFNWFLNFILPLFGIAFDIAVMYQGFFVADMSNPDFRIGPAVVYLCIAGTVAGAIYALWLRTRRGICFRRKPCVHRGVRGRALARREPNRVQRQPRHSQGATWIGFVIA